VRVSTLPSAHGERAVLRLLDKSGINLSLESVGMHGDVLQRVDRFDVHFVDHRSDATITNGLRKVGWHVPATALQLLQLPDLLIEGQLGQQVADARFD
jgi:hypothetical protein